MSSIFGDWSGDELAGVWDTASGWASSYDTPRGSGTVTSDAVQSMTPVDTSANGSNWGTFFQGTLSNLFGYAVQRDALKQGYEAQAATNSQKTAQTYLATRQQSGGLGGMLPILLVGGVIFLAVKAAK